MEREGLLTNKIGPNLVQNLFNVLLSQLQALVLVHDLLNVQDFLHIANFRL